MKKSFLFIVALLLSYNFSFSQENEKNVDTLINVDTLNLNLDTIKAKIQLLENSKDDYFLISIKSPSLKKVENKKLKNFLKNKKIFIKTKSNELLRNNPFPFYNKLSDSYLIEKLNKKLSKFREKDYSHNKNYDSKENCYLFPIIFQILKNYKNNFDCYFYVDKNNNIKFYLYASEMKAGIYEMKNDLFHFFSLSRNKKFYFSIEEYYSEKK